VGLLDNILGGFGSSSSGGSSPTSPLVKALLILLAAKAVSSHFGGGSSATQSAPSGSASDAQPSGRIESGMMAGLPSLDSILHRLRGSGHEDAVNSWIGTGENKPLSPQQVPTALGPEAIDHLQKETGLPRDQLLQQISQVLPQLVDKLTPDGRLPPPNQRSHW
jgi:uncharacterized protein YidB (DUF937 family)